MVQGVEAGPLCAKGLQQPLEFDQAARRGDGGEEEGEGGGRRGGRGRGGRGGREFITPLQYMYFPPSLPLPLPSLPGESVGSGVGVVILGEGGIVLEEVDCWNGIPIDLTHQLDTPPSLQFFCSIPLSFHAKLWRVYQFLVAGGGGEGEGVQPILAYMPMSFGIEQQRHMNPLPECTCKAICFQPA